MEIFTGMEENKLTESPITGEMLEKWRCYLNAFPLPPHLTPTGSRPLANVDDEALLNCPPQLIAHIQRTASQGGYQVISPRQTPFSSLMLRRSGEERLLADHEVGSVSDPNDEWPTIDGADFSKLLPDEPLAAATEEVTMRPKTRTTSVAKGHQLMSDPVLSCLIKGRAVIDILKRDDVCGGADEMAELLASAWGIEVEELMELEAYSLGLEGDLQRHCMKTDEVYPMMYAPVHVRGVITAGVSDMDKSLLPPFVAMDWRRMRVFCESVFYNSCMVEGVPIKYARTASTPGTRGDGRSRQNMLVFGPAPATAWSYAPETFCVFPTSVSAGKRKPGIPPEVRLALQKYVETVRPVSYLLAKGKAVDTWRSAVEPTKPPTGETLSSAYSKVTRTMMKGTVRGKTAAAAVRNAIYEQLQSAKINIRTRLVRYLEIATSECREHLGVQIVPDVVIHELAGRFSTLGVTVRERLLKEAEMRGSTIEDWWDDLLAQAPDHYSEMNEGTFGWAKLAIWMMLREPTEKWAKLKYASKMSALSDAAAASVGSIELPAEKGSIDRLVVACRHAVREISTAFAGYYQGVADVGFAIAKAAEFQNKTTTASVLREGSYMWSLRARTLSAINVSPLSHEEKLKSDNHIRVSAEPVDVVLKPSPYMAYKAWSNHVEKSDSISKPAKRMIKEAEKPVKSVSGEVRRSSIFSRMDRPIIPCKVSMITRYLCEPHKLGDDMEKAWRMLSNDVKKVVRTHSREFEEMTHMKEKSSLKVASEDVTSEPTEPEHKRYKVDTTGPRGKPLRDFWEVFSEEGQDVSEGILDDISKLPDDMGYIFYEGEFEDVPHILDTLDRIREEVEQTSRPMGDLVR